MTFVAGAVLWSAYTLAWWGWQALTDRVPPGQPDTIHWPSIRDLVAPGRISVANRPPATSALADPGNLAYDPAGVSAAQHSPGQSLPMGPGVSTPSVGTSTNPVRGA